MVLGVLNHHNFFVMKQLLPFTLLSFLLVAFLSATAQENGSFTFQILDFKGSPVKKARLIVMNGESHFASYNGTITYFGEEDYVKKNGVMVKTHVMPHYITVKAPDYHDRTIDLTQHQIGSHIVVKMDKLDKMSTDYKSIDVYVKDANGKPVSGAGVRVNPGKSTTTDGAGYAKAMHTILLSGEWVAIEVYKEGYKIQTQNIPSGDAPRMENGKQIPPATAYFTLEKGGNKSTIFHINVEVLDNDDNSPVPGAKVILELSDGDTRSDVTNAKGEFRFSDVEYSFAGLTAKVKVSKDGYEEKWSDITADLMEGVDNPERQFLVYLKKKNEGVTGEWDLICCSNKYTSKVKLLQKGNDVTGNFYNSNNGTTGDVKGTVSGNTVNFTRTWGSSKQTYNLSLSQDGKKLNGNFEGTRDPSVGTEVTLTKRQ
jgi:hypothetical protein